jgi:hypothetical protein
LPPLSISIAFVPGAVATDVLASAAIAAARIRNPHLIAAVARARVGR